MDERDRILPEVVARDKRGGRGNSTAIARRISGGTLARDMRWSPLGVDE